MCEHSKQENRNYFSLSFKQVAYFEQIRFFPALYRIYKILFFCVLIPIVLSNDLYYVKLWKSIYFGIITRLNYLIGFHNLLSLLLLDLLKVILDAKIFKFESSQPIS